MDPEVAVAEREPRLSAERLDRLERLPRLAGASPAALLVVQPGQRVQHRVEIGRDVQPQHLDVVADVAGDGDVARVHGVDEPLHEPRTADAAGENDHLHAVTS